MGDLELILAANLLSCLMMTGLVWFVQVVHYPLFAQVPLDRLIAYEKSHSRRTGAVVIPLMLIELVSTVLLCFPRYNLEDSSLPMVGAIILAVVWISTFALQVPCHRKLSRAGDYAVVQRLIKTNWIRTIGWSARSVIVMAMVFSDGGFLG